MRTRAPRYCPSRRKQMTLQLADGSTVRVPVHARLIAQLGRLTLGLSGTAALRAIGALMLVMFMGSTLVTPLYALYRHAFGFRKLR